MLIFIHGLESSGSGYKGRFFKEIFPEILTPDFTGNFENRMELLRKILKGNQNITIIGSSYGGLMATKYAIDHPERVNKLILLAPAIIYENVIAENARVYTPTIIFHGIKDDVVDLNKTRELAQKIFKDLNFIEVDDDHFLHKTIHKIKWKELIKDY